MTYVQCLLLLCLQYQKIRHNLNRKLLKDMMIQPNCGIPGSCKKEWGSSYVERSILGTTRNDWRWGLINSYSLHPLLPVPWEWPAHMRGVNLKHMHLGLGKGWTPSKTQHLLTSQQCCSSSEGLAGLPEPWPATSVKAESDSCPVQRTCGLLTYTDLELLAKPLTYGHFRKKDKPLNCQELFSVGSSTDD